MAQYNAPLPDGKPWPKFDSIQYISSASNVTLSYLQSNYLQLSGGMLTGGLNAININMSCGVAFYIFI